MWTHTYWNFKNAVLESLDYICESGHVIHEGYRTIFYADICWC